MRLIKMVTPAVLVLFALAMPQRASAGFGISITVEPPALPVYVQPEIPGPGYIWTPGYWGYDDDDSDYYWVPGAWTEPPSVGLLWTPPYYGWNDGVYVFHDGYWGPHVGFYGGISYGFGYTGIGFAGGYWSGGVFNYNRSVTNISNTTIIQNTYVKNVTNNNTTNVSYNGGKNGTAAQPTPQEKLALADQHTPATPAQTQQTSVSKKDPNAKLSANSGKPPVAALQKAGDFKSNVVRAKASGTAALAKGTNTPSTLGKGTGDASKSALAKGAGDVNNKNNTNNNNNKGATGQRDRKLAAAGQTGTGRATGSGNSNGKTAQASRTAGPRVMRTRAGGDNFKQRGTGQVQRQGQGQGQRNAKKGPPPKHDDKKKPT